MPYTIARYLEEVATFVGEPTTQFSRDKLKFIAEEALTYFLTAKWPFNEGEGVVNCRAPYTTGTVAVSAGGSTVTLTGGTWSTSWTTPAIIRITGSSGDAFVVTAFPTSTTATIDGTWPYDAVTAGTYSLEFPSHAIDSYISVTGAAYNRLSLALPLTPGSFEELLAERPWVPQSFWPGKYAVIPADGTNGQKIFVWPPPAQVGTLRYRYVKAVPAFRHYRAGTANATNSNTAVSGSGTLWSSQGYSMAGQYFELLAQPGHQVLIASVTNDTALVLTTGGYTGVTATGALYAISPAILCPDDLKPLLRAIARWKYMQDAMPNLAPEAERRAMQLKDEAISRYNIARDARPVQPILMGDPDWGGPPEISAILEAQ